MYGPLVIIIIFLIASLPVIAVYFWFRLAKYPFTLIRFLFALLAGAAAFFPALILQELMRVFIVTGGSSPRWTLFYQFFIRIAFTEELSRLLMLLIFFWISRRLNPDEHSGLPPSWLTVKKATATGLIAGLGFAILESAVYASSNVSTLLLRTVTAAPLHAACGSRIGLAAVLLRKNPIQSLFRIFTAVVIHGVYNLLVSGPGFSSIIAILIALSALLTSISTIRGSWAPQETPAADEAP